MCKYCENKDKCKLIIPFSEIINCEKYKINIANNKDYKTIIDKGIFFNIVIHNTDAFIMCEYVNVIHTMYYIPRLLMRKIFPTEEQAAECAKEFGYSVRSTLYDV